MELIINGINIYENLCYWDTRNPDSSVPYDIETGYYDEDDPPPEPRVDCSCDGCFRGKDRLAMIIIELHEQNIKLEKEVAVRIRRFSGE